MILGVTKDKLEEIEHSLSDGGTHEIETKQYAFNLARAASEHHTQ